MKFTGERFIPREDAEAIASEFQNKMEAEHFVRYNFASQFVEGKRVLDLGSGSGYGSQILFEKGHANSVWGIDLSDEATNYATNTFGNEKVSFKVSTADDTGFENGYFDVVTCFELIEHVKEYSNLIDEVKRVLKKDGVFIVSTPHKKGETTNPFHVHEFELKEFSGILNGNFNNTTLHYQYNTFTSIVLSECKGTDVTGVEISQELIPKNVDFIIGVCTNGTDTISNLFEVYIGNYTYIGTLERDIDILHRAEKDNRKQIENNNILLEEKTRELEESKKAQELLEVTQQEVKKLKRDLNLIINSRSWRFIEKLRSIKQRLRRFI
jgi:ubiquinone/menaquinone biosynthesis C-methylase UbiE